MLEADKMLKNKVENLTDFLLTMKQGVKKPQNLGFFGPVLECVL